MPYKDVNTNYIEKVSKLHKPPTDQERRSYRYQRLIAEAAKKIVTKQTKILSNKDYSEISQEVYNKSDKISTIRVKRQLSQEITKRDVNEAIRTVLLQNKFDENKILELIKKAETSAKSTKDYLDVIKEMKDILIPASPKVSIQETRSHNYSEYRENKPSKITQTIKVETSQKDNNDVPEQDNDVSE